MFSLFCGRKTFGWWWGLRRVMTPVISRRGLWRRPVIGSRIHLDWTNVADGRTNQQPHDESDGAGEKSDDEPQGTLFTPCGGVLVNPYADKYPQNYDEYPKQTGKSHKKCKTRKRVCSRDASGSKEHRVHHILQMRSKECRHHNQYLIGSY